MGTARDDSPPQFPARTRCCFGYFRRDPLSCRSGAVQYPHTNTRSFGTSQLSGLGDFLARSAPYTLCLVLLRFPMFDPRFGAGAGVSDIRRRAVHVAPIWSCFFFIDAYFSGGLYSPAILGLSFLVLFSLASIYCVRLSRCIRVVSRGASRFLD